jgi:tripartite-type tricarboxylate transporter receptor subunit TctC
MQSMSKLIRTTLAGLLLILAGQTAMAQTGTIKIVVGYPPGATSDSLTRMLADAMSKQLNQAVIVENKTGAGGQIGNLAVKSAPADGLTLLMTPVATMSIFPHSFAGKLKYDPLADFAPVAHLTNFQVGLGVGVQVPANNLAEYVAWVKSDPVKNGLYGSAANGSLPHFFGVMFGKAAGLELSHVPYRGTAAAMQALMGGEITALSTVAADIRALVQSNRARLLAVAGEARSPNFPDVPTFRELGYDLVAKPWYALYAPSGTPAETIARLSKAAIDSIKDPAMSAKLVEMGLEPTGLPPTELAAIMKADYDRWGPPIKASGFKPN